ncbi:MAG: hypothetical protein ACXVCV_15675, partial [Polyangia bacterium]
MGERGVVAAVLGAGLAVPVLAATAAIARVVPGARVPAWIVGGLVAAGLFVAALRSRRRLPASLDGVARRRPLRTGLWVLLALLSLAQLGRLGAFMADPQRTWGSTIPDPNVTDHMCMTAYVYAAELSRARDPNLYDEAHWPAFDTVPAPPPRATSVVELAEHLSDPYEYPPPFLLLPRLALALTNHFLVV